MMKRRFLLERLECHRCNHLHLQTRPYLVRKYLSQNYSASYRITVRYYSENQFLRPQQPMRILRKQLQQKSLESQQ
ncbi:MAG: hypothetical protein ACTSXM_02985 [Promethearchaeota archaeon]